MSIFWGKWRNNFKRWHFLAEHAYFQLDARVFQIKGAFICKDNKCAMTSFNRIMLPDLISDQRQRRDKSKCKELNTNLFHLRLFVKNFTDLLGLEEGLRSHCASLVKSI